ncbi:MAG: aminopeptidase P family protein [Candidatus Aminicenantes bacterium]|nr:aminopeptidase P family protein [Candidatus Aminicenantes bacterium]
MFDRDVYRARREGLRRGLGPGIALFLGNDESPMNYADNTYRFRQDSSFLYYFGLDTAGLVAIIDLDEGTETLYGPELTVEDFVWTGPLPSLGDRAALAGVERVMAPARLEEDLGRIRQAGRAVHFLPPYRPENKLKLLAWLGVPPDRASAEASVPFIRAVVEQRSVKSPEEIAEIEKAVDISVDMHLAALRLVRPGFTEARIAAAVHQVALAAGGDLSFPIIATVHGEVLHQHAQTETLTSGGMFLLDAGAETALHYAGDLSTTMPVDGRFTDRQKDVYRIALAAHETAKSALKPGAPHLDVHLAACRMIAEGLKGLGLMKGDLDEAVRRGAHALFFPCGEGHMMGLDVHDMEDLGEVYVGYEGRPKSTQFGLKSLRLARPLRPGFVVTVEPGIYFIPQLIDQWRAENRFPEHIDYDRVEAYKDFGGLRNEEDVLITGNGHRVLGRKKPLTVEEIEALVGKADA